MPVLCKNRIGTKGSAISRSQSEVEVRSRGQRPLNSRKEAGREVSHAGGERVTGDLPPIDWIFAGSPAVAPRGCLVATELATATLRSIHTRRASHMGISAQKPSVV